MAHGGFPQVVISGAKSLLAPSFDEGARFIVVKDGKEAIIGSTTTLATRTWLTLPAGESFQGTPTWAGADVLFATSGGTPKRSRLYAIAAPAADDAAAIATTRRTLFTAEHGGGVMSWDRSPVAPHNALVVHRRANAMLAELVLVASGDSEVAFSPHVVARDCRVEYCRPQAAFLADGRIVARLNLASTCKTSLSAATHGLWTLDPKDIATSSHGEPAWALAHVCPALGEHGGYDVCSSSYANAHGVREGFVLDGSRETLVFTARSHDPARGMADALFKVAASDLGKAAASPYSEEATGKGCHVPIALGGGTLVYHFRSPTEAGDLWKHDGHGSARLTHTMPVALRAKLSAPEERVIDGRHALLFRPPPSDAPQPALVWAHGGPMAAFSFDYNPIAAWLASLGYFVCVPNFAGSTGFGIAVMDQVFGAGCGVADLEDCVAAANFVRTLDGVDARRGVAIAGHSWGGFLALRALTTPGALRTVV
eukprot:3375537-Prymnesium_polylepis.1